MNDRVFFYSKVTKEQVDITRYSFGEQQSERLPPNYPKKIRLSITPTGISSSPDPEYELTVLGFMQVVSFTLIPLSASKHACTVTVCAMRVHAGAHHGKGV